MGQFVNLGDVEFSGARIEVWKSACLPASPLKIADLVKIKKPTVAGDEPTIEKSTAAADCLLGILMSKQDCPAGYWNVLVRGEIIVEKGTDDVDEGTGYYKATAGKCCCRPLVLKKLQYNKPTGAAPNITLVPTLCYLVRV